jgi:glycosyltransferase involved in cell wall biosynthesis
VILQTHIWISHTKRDPLHWISYSLIDEVWCSSEPARKTLIEFLPLAASKIRVVKYGREIEKMESGFLSRQEAREQLGLPPDATVIGNVARIDEGKGTRELLEGALQAMDKHPGLHLVLIGPPTADDPKAVAFAESIRARIETLPPEFRCRVHALGAVADSYRVLRAFDLFALPTYCECFALSLLEALLAGVPCLATLSGGSAEMVREGETGWLFAPRSVDACFDAIERALRDRPQWPALGARGQAMVRRDFDFKNILPQTLEHYDNLTIPTLKV